MQESSSSDSPSWSSKIKSLGGNNDALSVDSCLEVGDEEGDEEGDEKAVKRARFDECCVALTFSG